MGKKPPCEEDSRRQEYERTNWSGEIRPIEPEDVRRKKEQELYRLGGERRGKRDIGREVWQNDKDMDKLYSKRNVEKTEPSWGEKLMKREAKEMEKSGSQVLKEYSNLTL